MATAVTVEDPPPNSADLEDYFSEINDIQSTKDDSGDTDDELSKTPDEGEQERMWLREVGLQHLVNKFEEGKDITDDALKKETATLTRKQAAAVKKRVETLNATRRKKKDKPAESKADVRDVFAGDGADVAGDVHTEKKDSTRPLSEPPVELRHNAAAKQRRRNGVFTSFDARHDGTGSKRVTIVRLNSRGEYSMTGDASMNAQTNNNTGVEGISIQTTDIDPEPSPRGTVYEPRTLLNDDVFTTEDANTSSVKIAKSSNIDKKDGLPHFITEPDELGLTHICDVNKKDAQKICSLCLIELTALYDHHDLTWQRRRTRRRHKESGIFGVPLQTLYEQDIKKYPYIKVPLFFDQLCDHLERCAVEEEGILRVPGSVSRIKQLRQEIEVKFQAGRFSWENVLPNDAAGLLKQMLRELPIPLLTFDYLDAFAQIDKVTDKSRKQQLQALNLLVLLLPDVHRNVLQMLLRLLKRIVDCSQNKMTLNNVAMIMAPNLFCVQRKPSKNKMPTIQEMDIFMATGNSNAVRMMIKYQDILWTVPSFIIAQVRTQYEVEQSSKSKDRSNFMKLFAKKEKESSKKTSVSNEADVSEGVIRVQAPHLSKDSTKVQLEHDTTAKDIVVKFYHAQLAGSKRAQLLNGRPSSEEALSPDDPFFLSTHLYEVGGNIGERKLHHDTKMMALIKVNTGAQWLVKTTPHHS